MNHYDWEDLHHFSALAQTLHLGRAARLLGGSPVTVMRRVRALEAALDATLFVRHRHGHRLTSAGLALKALVDDAIPALDGVAALMAKADTRQRGRVCIATTEIGADWLLVPQVPAFAARHPEIRLAIDASPQATDLLGDSETLALRFRRPEMGDHVVQRLASLPFGIYGPQELVAGAVAAWASRGVLDAPYIGWTGFCANIGADLWLQTVFAPRQPSLSLATLQGHIHAAQAGLGLAGLPVFIGRQLAGLHRVPDVTPGFSLDAWLVVPSQTRRAPKIRTVSEFVRQAVRQALETPTPGS